MSILAFNPFWASHTLFNYLSLVNSIRIVHVGHIVNDVTVVNTIAYVMKCLHTLKKTQIHILKKAPIFSFFVGDRVR